MIIEDIGPKDRLLTSSFVEPFDHKYEYGGVPPVVVKSTEPFAEVAVVVATTFALIVIESGSRTVTMIVSAHW